MDTLKRAEELFVAGQLGEAERLLEDVLKRQPTNPQAMYTLAHVRLQQGRAAEACHLMQTLSKYDRHPQSHSDLLFYGLHAAPEGMQWIHRQWYARFTPKGTTRPAPDWDGKRKLRVGYLSCNFKSHTVTTFLEPILRHHGDKVEVFVYCDNEHDAVTERLKGYGHAWRDVVQYTDTQLYRGLRADRLDLLVDLTGFLNSGRRQQVVAAGPAPHVINYIGYPFQTTRDAYRVTDIVADPEVGDERIVRLRGCAWAYQPDDAAPEVTPLPAESNGYVTFGSFHRACKISPATAKAWARVLEGVPGSRLMVLAQGGEGNTGLRKVLEAAGIDGQRLSLVPTADRAGYLSLFSRVDVMLDTWPYSAMTVACESLWQGVPLVTLAGKLAVSRAAASILTAVGMSDQIAATPDEYVAKVVQLASDVSALSKLRAGLRQRVADSALVDGKLVAEELERAYASLFPLPEKQKAKGCNCKRSKSAVQETTDSHAA